MVFQPQSYFCLRLRKNEYVEIADDIWIKLQELGVNPGVALYLEGVKITKTKGFSPANIAEKWKRQYRSCSVEEAWFILTNLTDLTQALSAYQKRFGIEEMFRDYKSGGYNLEATGVTGNRLIAIILLIILLIRAC